jgi:hypothetical protein
MPNAKTEVDRDALHRLMWAEADSRGVLKLHQRTWARELAITHFTMSRIVHEFIDTGRLEKLGSSKTNVSSYIVADPAAWHATWHGRD